MRAANQNTQKTEFHGQAAQASVKKKEYGKPTYSYEVYSLIMPKDVRAPRQQAFFTRVSFGYGWGMDDAYNRIPID